MNHRGVLVVISGFSGAGKGTLMKSLVSKYDYALSISMTTRTPRQGEVDGKDYFFVTKEKFEETISEGGLIEYANYCNNYYGTPRDYVNTQLEAGRDVILEIEAQGALQIKKKFPDSFLVFVMTPSVDELEKRLMGRGTETPEVIESRMQRAAQEVDYISSYDAIVVNDEIDACRERLHEIIQAARFAVDRNTEYIETFRREFAERRRGE